MTFDEKVRTGLVICASSRTMEDCLKCPYRDCHHDCTDVLAKEAHVLVDRLSAELTEQTARADRCRKALNEEKKMVKDLQATVAKLQGARKVPVPDEPKSITINGEDIGKLRTEKYEAIQLVNCYRYELASARSHQKLAADAAEKLRELNRVKDEEIKRLKEENGLLKAQSKAKAINETFTNPSSGERNKPLMHRNICAALNALYERKNADYGDSFGKSFTEYGMTMACIRLEDKLNRIKALTKTEAKVKDESIEDTLMDLANYSIMTLIELFVAMDREVYDNGEN